MGTIAGPVVPLLCAAKDRHIPIIADIALLMPGITRSSGESRHGRVPKLP